MYLRDEHVVGSLRVIADHLRTNLSLQRSQFDARDLF